MQYDHILNGSSSRQRHQDMIQQAQYNHMLDTVEQNERKNRFSIRNLIMTLITMLTG